MKKKAEVEKKRTVEEVFRDLCAKDEVFQEGRCVRIKMNPKEKTIVYEELSSCKIESPKVDPIEERAKQKLFKMLYRDPKSKLRYIETVRTDEEEGESEEVKKEE